MNHSCPICSRKLIDSKCFECNYSQNYKENKIVHEQVSFTKGDLYIEVINSYYYLCFYYCNIYKHRPVKNHERNIKSLDLIFIKRIKFESPIDFSNPNLKNKILIYLLLS